MFDLIAGNPDLVGLGWLGLTFITEVLKRVIKGTKDDKVIVKVMDIAGKVLTLGGAKLLPYQDGRR